MRLIIYRSRSYGVKDRMSGGLEDEGWWLVAHGHEDDMMYGMHSLAACEF